MATKFGQATQNAALCDFCHSKQKFPPYHYCSKTCAAQAGNPKAGAMPTVGGPQGFVSIPSFNKAPASTSTLCNYCQKNPKHPGHDFCGKGCASKAKSGSGGPQPAINNIPNPAAPVQNSTAKKPFKASNSNNGFQGAGAGAGGLGAGNANPGSVDPMQIANLVVQQIQTLYPNGTMAAQASATTGGGGPLNTIMTATKQFLAHGTTKGVNTAFAASGGNPIKAGVSAQTYYQAEPAECLIPGCEQPVYVDANGFKSSAYCSMRHREEAVTYGLVEPCIFCLKLPQSESDYFCSRECREDSMNKQLVDSDSDIE